MTSAEELHDYILKNENRLNFLNQNDDIYMFKGIYASNELPDLSHDEISNGVFMIVNFDPNTKEGSHWIGMRIKKNKCEYFDSYGEKPDEDDGILNDTTHFKEYLEQYGKNFKYNPYDLQGKYSSVCGHYSVMFAYTGLDYDVWRTLGFILTPKAKISGHTISQSASQQVYDHNDALIQKIIDI